jgi:hypothetical protein
MKAIKVVSVAGSAQISSLAANDKFKAEAVADTNGNPRVPDAYRTTYEFLRTWAVAADQGQGSKELHVVYTCPAVICRRKQQSSFALTGTRR